MAELPPTKRKHRVTHGRRKAMREANTPPVDPRTKHFDASLANEIQLLREYKKSWDNVMPYGRKLMECPIHERPYRMADFIRKLKFETERIDAFIENRPEPSYRTKRLAKIVLAFEEKFKESLIPESERLKTQILDEKIHEYNLGKYLDFQHSKLESESIPSPYAEKYKKLHLKQEEMLRRNLNIPEGMATPPRSIEEVEARIAELKKYNESLPLQPYHVPRLWENIQNLDKIHTSDTKRELLRGSRFAVNRSEETGRVSQRYFVANPTVPKWDIVGPDDRIIERYNYEEEAIEILNRNPDKGLKMVYRGPDLNILPEKISRRMKSPWYFVYDHAGNIVNRFRSSIQAHAFAHDNGLRLDVKTEYAKARRKRRAKRKLSLDLNQEIPNENI